jgi:FkbM family methyltransferase
MRVRAGSALNSWANLARYTLHGTLEGPRYFIRNPWILFASAGTIELTDGSRWPFDASTKSEVLRIVWFALDHGVRFGRRDGEWRYDPDTRVVTTPSGLRFHQRSFDSGIFAETFLDEIHFIDFDLAGKVVVEGGTFVGDTALYYAQHGARVYSFEPDPRAYELAQRNMELNPRWAPSIALRPQAIGTDGEIDFPVVGETGGNGSTSARAERYVRVRSTNLSQILCRHGLSHAFLLHLDIKGEEFAVIEDPALERFDRLRIEYSPYLRQRSEETLARLLDRIRSAGFPKVRVFKHNGLRYDLRRHGTIDARRAAA